MGISPYAAIVIGSKNMLMKVYEISGGKGFRTVDEIRYEYELGKEAYFTRKITFAQIEEICTDGISAAYEGICDNRIPMLRDKCDS